MRQATLLTRFFDLGAGFLAIVAVLSLCISIHAVGMDLRMLLSVSGVAFFLAGLIRGQSGRHNVWLHGLLVSSPGLLGTVALIMNNGPRHLLVPTAVTAVSVTMAIAGVQARRFWALGRVKASQLGAVALCALGAFAFAAGPLLSQRGSLKEMKQPAPAFKMTALDGTPVNSADLRRRVVVLAFWATSCAACKMEMTELQSLYLTYQHDPRVAIYAVDANWPGESSDRARAFLAHKQLTLPATFDENGDAEKALDIDALPSLIVLDQQGNIRLSHVGYDFSEHLEDLLARHVNKLLKE